MSKNNVEEEIHFQVVVISVKDPINNDIHKCNFVGPALMSSERWEKIKDKPISEVLAFWPVIGDPYNPFKDKDNVDAHRYLTDLVRNISDKSNG